MIAVERAKATVCQRTLSEGHDEAEIDGGGGISGRWMRLSNSMRDARILENEVTPKFVVAVAVAVLWCGGSAAMAQSTPADGLDPVACNSAGNLYALLDAADRNDKRAETRLSAENCENLSDRRYEVVGQKNGVVTIRLFPRDGDRTGPRLAVTLDEMVESDLYPGSEGQPSPSS
jgi:hypothetical protein